jgi:hypothetical protein
MVLQRAPQATTLYGFAAAGTVVTTTFRGANLTVTASPTGEWRQALPPTAASTPSAGGETLRFACSTGEVFAINNVLFGDVVICGGQSNMCVALQRKPAPLRLPVSLSPITTLPLQAVHGDANHERARLERIC